MQAVDCPVFTWALPGNAPAFALRFHVNYLVRNRTPEANQLAGVKFPDADFDRLLYICEKMNG